MHGINKYFSWNTDNKCKRLPIINREREISSNAKENTYETKFHRVLSYSNMDISTFNSHWNG